MSEGTAPRPYSWLPVLISVLPVIMLAIGGIAFRYTETRMVATAGETLALTAAEVSDKLDRFLIERYGDVLMMARTFSAQPYNREFQSAYVAGVKAAYPDYLWVGATNARGQIVVATDPATLGRDYSAQPWFQAVRNGLSHSPTLPPRLLIYNPTTSHHPHAALQRPTLVSGRA